MFKRSFSSNCIEGKDEEGIIFCDYETRKRLVAPFMLVALVGSNKEAVPINVSTLDEVLLDELKPYNFDSEEILDSIVKGEQMYTLISADASYNLASLPNFLEKEYSVLGIKGCLSFDLVGEYLPNIHKYFNPDNGNGIDNVKPSDRPDSFNDAFL